MPFEQVPPWQLCPHAPQLCGSLCVFQQPPAHAVYPLLQVTEQLPALQEGAPLVTLGHALHDEPQWFASDCVSQQPPAHCV
jgi:hypothetical protein